jgi:hypothetical protein
VSERAGLPRALRARTLSMSSLSSKAMSQLIGVARAGPFHPTSVNG